MSGPGRPPSMLGLKDVSDFVVLHCGGCYYCAPSVFCTPVGTLKSSANFVLADEKH